MEETKKKFPWKPVAVLTVCLILIAGLLWFNTAPEIEAYLRPPISAQQVNQTVRAVLGYKGMFDDVRLPDAAIDALPNLPNDIYLPVYQQTFTTPTPERVEALLDEVIPIFSQMYAAEIPRPEIQTGEYTIGGSYCRADALVAENEFSVVNNNEYLLARIWNHDRPILSINCTTVTISPVLSDEELMASLSDTVSYLEQLFGKDLSAHTVRRNYNIYIGEISSISVYLYAPDAEVDEILKTYEGKPAHYCSGDYLVLQFSPPEQDSAGFDCRNMWYYKSQKAQYEVYGKYSKRSLFDAELLLHKGFRFMFRNCKTCNARSETPDFHGYDRVTLEYVFGDEDGDFGFPFYVFYKRTGDGNEYIKTMVPAVAVSGMDDFFKLQRAEMNPPDKD